MNAKLENGYAKINLKQNLSNLDENPYKNLDANSPNLSEEKANLRSIL